MRVPDDLLTNLLSYVPFIELNKYMIILSLPDELKKKIQKTIFYQRLRIVYYSRCIYYSHSIHYVLDGKLYNLYGPAVTQFDPVPDRRGNIGRQSWYINGKLHSTDGPAEIYSNGTEKWYLYGKLHNSNGPAVTFENGKRQWYQHGKLHNSNGPAVIYKNGKKLWFIHGELHRIDGPASMPSYGNNTYYLYGKKIKPSKYWGMVNKIINKLQP